MVYKMTTVALYCILRYFTRVRGYNTQFLFYPQPLSWWN